jgi:hypothetical protein
MHRFLFLKIGPHIRCRRASLSDAGEKTFYVCFRQRLSADNRREKNQGEQERG